ncbi:MAG: UDP-N-acetylmuramoyl-tripeptide--D-alanyl-D-alanine ligase, partial [Spirochaetota bacterium]
AADHRSALTIPVIGITGTNGKTTTKELVSCALSSRYRVHRNQKNFNNDIGVPFTLFDCTADHTAAVIEMGMNHAGEISYLSSLVMPDVSIITNADAGHLEFLGSVEEVAHAKSEIFESMAEGATVFINRDTITYDILEENAKKRKLDVVSYGFSDAADLRMDGYTLGKDFTEVVYKGVPCRVLLYGIHNVANVLVSMAVAEHFGVSPGESARALAAFRNESMRNQITETDFTLINDAYNANPLSMRGALESMSLVFPDRRKIAVLGDMKELGAGVGKFHEELGAQCAVYKTDMVFLYGDHAADVARGARSAGMDSGSIFVYKEKHDLVKSLKDTVVDGDVVLVKGSRSMKMEEVADALVCC